MNLRWVARSAAALVSILLVSLSVAPSLRADPASQWEMHQLRAACYEMGGCFSLEDLPQEVGQELLQLYRSIYRASSLSDNVTVYVSGSRHPNAWALKHFTGITAGMLRAGYSRDELAFVAAHELAHIELRHFELKQREYDRIWLAAGLAILLSILLCEGCYNPLNDPLFVVVSQLALAAYSRDQEKAADLRALAIMRQAGFDPLAAASALRKLDPLGVSNTGDFFDDHPSVQERIARVTQELGRVTVSPAPSAPPTSATVPKFANVAAMPGERLGPIPVNAHLREVTQHVGKPHDRFEKTQNGTIYTWSLPEGDFTTVKEGESPWVSVVIDDKTSRVLAVATNAVQFRTPGGNGVGSLVDGFMREFGSPKEIQTEGSTRLWIFRQGIAIGFGGSQVVTELAILRP